MPWGYIPASSQTRIDVRGHLDERKGREESKQKITGRLYTLTQKSDKKERAPPCGWGSYLLMVTRRDASCPRLATSGKLSSSQPAWIMVWARSSVVGATSYKAFTFRMSVLWLLWATPFFWFLFSFHRDFLCIDFLSIVHLLPQNFTCLNNCHFFIQTLCRYLTHKNLSCTMYLHIVKSPWSSRRVSVAHWHTVCLLQLSGFENRTLIAAWSAAFKTMPKNRILAKALRGRGFRNVKITRKWQTRGGHVSFEFASDAGTQTMKLPTLLSSWHDPATKTEPFPPKGAALAVLNSYFNPENQSW